MTSRNITSLLLVVADGVRPDLLAQAINRGALPSLDALARQGGLYTVTTSFPSVTGPAYLPFLMGRHPARLGMPGLRWYDRARQLRLGIGNARSYSGVDIWRTHDDVDASVPTLFDVAAPSLASMSIFARGATGGNIGRSLPYMARSALPHFRGDPQGWRDLEQRATREFLHRFAKERPRFAALVLNTPDKVAHRWGVHSPQFDAALRDVDAAVAGAEIIASRDGWREQLAIWVVSDHGHSAVEHHDDLHGWMEERGHRLIAHPRLRTRRADIALMVGGNAMAHVYLQPQERQRHWWMQHGASAQCLHDAMVQRASVDVVAVALSSTSLRVTNGSAGSADIVQDDTATGPRWTYAPIDGDPLQLGGRHVRLDAADAWDVTASTPRPDCLVQLAALTTAPRSGDIVVSAALHWDLRARHESVPHVSTHGALLREQMLVPLLLDRPVRATPRRTVDIAPSALQLLSLDSIPGFEGDSFL